MEDKKDKAPKNNVQENKSQMSLIPLDILSDILVPTYMEGLIKYSRESWRKGFLMSTMMDSAQRHLSDFFYKGEDYDPDAQKLGINKTHLGGVLFSILCMADTFLNHPELDDRKIKKEMEEFTTELSVLGTIQEIIKLAKGIGLEVSTDQEEIELLIKLLKEK